ncbi:LEF-12 [Choristoneura occidentalis alphabaculovirus]|nr:LEF-12 [Choristoneura occidentalis alphabaculovirus]
MTLHTNLIKLSTHGCISMRRSRCVSPLHQRSWHASLNMAASCALSSGRVTSTKSSTSWGVTCSTAVRHAMRKTLTSNTNLTNPCASTCTLRTTRRGNCASTPLAYRLYDKKVSSCARHTAGKNCVVKCSDCANMESLAIADENQFRTRLAYVADIAAMMRRTLDFMAVHGACTPADANTLCWADDTAAWLCGRVDVCTFASFRVRIAAFQHPCRVLAHFLFEESLAQRCSGPLPRYTYMNYAMFKGVLAIKLTVYIGNLHADGPPYFVDLALGRAQVRTTAALHFQLPPFERRVEEVVAQSVAE